MLIDCFIRAIYFQKLHFVMSAFSTPPIVVSRKIEKSFRTPASFYDKEVLIWITSMIIS